MLHRNLALKIAAVLLAVFLWFWVTMNERGARQIGQFEPRAPASPRVAARTVAVVLQTEGALPPGVKLIGAQVEPPMVTVIGSVLSVSRVDEIRTARLDLRGASGSFTRAVPLVVPRGIQVPNTTAVKVTVTLERAEAGPLSSAPPSAGG
jgi:YbbR domain-containing protein